MSKILDQKAKIGSEKSDLTKINVGSPIIIK